MQSCIFGGDGCCQIADVFSLSGNQRRNSLNFGSTGLILSRENRCSVRDKVQNVYVPTTS
jgi:hypothetical protein